MSHRIALSASLAVFMLVSGPAASQQERNFYDDFQGSSLNPAFRVLNPDRQRMALTQGEYLLLVTHRDGKNVIEYTGVLPEDYVVTLRVAAPPVHQGQAIGLRAGSLDNSTHFGASVDLRMVEGFYGSQLYFYSNKVIDGERAQEINIRGVDLGEPFYLRLERREIEYEGFFSPDGSRWTSIGTQVLIASDPGLFVDVFNWADAPETPVKIDSFEITEILN